ncbi:MAG: alcohol dehydrogenase catalytic domain-containing protein [Bacteroidales bacterium]|nr:alcohol dehydrogenase catalytic domain-containing protein [Bacteroidales bacterium]
MKAICLKKAGEVKLRDVPEPRDAQNGHLIVEMEACAINSGDLAFIGGAFPHGSQYEMCGVSGVGKVIAIGEGVSREYEGRNVAIYRSLRFTNHIVGTWCEYSQVHHLNCVILPDNVAPIDYSGSLVNTITPYAFIKQIREEGHQGIICTAGNSATGLAMLGMCQEFDVPLISLVRSEKAKIELEEMDASHILVQTDPKFERQLQELSNQLKTTAVFDGVGGTLLGKVAKVIPQNSSIYTYGFLGGNEPLSIHTSTILMRGLTIRGFGNFTSRTVKDSEELNRALNDINQIIHKPHFKTNLGRTFKLQEIESALQFHSSSTGKSVLLLR